MISSRFILLKRQQPQVSPCETLLKFTPWNQILRLTRLSPAIPATKLLQNCNYQSAAIPPGPAPWNQNTCLKNPSLEFQVTQSHHIFCHRFNVIPPGPAPWNQNTCLKNPSLEFQVTQSHHIFCHRFNLIPPGRSALSSLRPCFFVVHELRADSAPFHKKYKRKP